MGVSLKRGGLIRLPNSDAINPSQIEGIQLVAGKGILLKGFEKTLAWIPCANDVDGALVRDELFASAEAAAKGARYQPDWSFLTAKKVA